MWRLGAGSDAIMHAMRTPHGAMKRRRPAWRSDVERSSSMPVFGRSVGRPAGRAGLLAAARKRSFMGPPLLHGVWAAERPLIRLAEARRMRCARSESRCRRGRAWVLSVWHTAEVRPTALVRSSGRPVESSQGFNCNARGCATVWDVGARVAGPVAAGCATGARH